VAGFRVRLQRPFGRPGSGDGALLRPARRHFLLGLGGALSLPLGFGAMRYLPGAFRAAAQAETQDPDYLRIGGGVVGSRLYQLAAALAGAISNPPGADGCDPKGPCGVPGLVGLAQTTSGSIENLQNLRSGGIESAVAQADLVDAALGGSDPFKSAGPDATLRGLARIGSAALQVMVPAVSPCKEIADLKGRTVGLGAKGGDAAFTGRALLAAYGITAKRAKFDFSDMPSATAALTVGKLDALVVVDGAPNPDIAALVEARAVRFLPIEGDGVTKLINDRPYLKATSIPAGAYKDLPAIPSISVPILWAASSSLDPKLAHALVTALASQVAPDGGGNAANQQLIDFTMADQTAPLALHPGALAFYQERKSATSTN